jgi:hypothetical protein
MTSQEVTNSLLVFGAFLCVLLQEAEIKFLVQEIKKLQHGNNSDSSSDGVSAELAELLLQNTKLKHRLAVLKRVSFA